MANKPLSVKFMSFWENLDPSIRYGAAYVFSLVLTLMQQILSGIEWKEAVITFLGALVPSVLGLQAVSKVAKEKKAESSKY